MPGTVPATAVAYFRGDSKLGCHWELCQAWSISQVLLLLPLLPGSKEEEKKGGRKIKREGWGENEGRERGIRLKRGGKSEED